MHGMLVEFFGFNFLDITKSLVYIKKVPLYIPAVLGSSIIAVLLFRWSLKKITGLLTGSKKKHLTESDHERKMRVREQKEKTEKIFRIARSLVFMVLFLTVALIMLFGFGKDNTRTVGGLKVIPPEGFSKTASSTRNVIWKYTQDDKKPGILILDEEIKGDQGQRFTDVEAVLEECFWLRDAELYINPHGIRMVRGYSIEFSDCPERRYYVETDGAVFLLCMIEDDRYYDPADCEEAMKQTADSIRR